MTHILYDKRSCLARAVALLEKRDDGLLRSACLELRFCLEAITYEKLKLYARQLPQSVLETWQPPQAMQALLEFEPLADRDFELRFAEESKEGQPIGPLHSLGEHRGLRLAWLRKTYNKLGSYLHIPNAATAETIKVEEPKREDLDAIVAELKHVAESRFDSSITEVVEFLCAVCGERVIANAERVLETKKAVCLNPQCKAEHFAKLQADGSILFELKQKVFECAQCHEPIYIEIGLLRLGAVFRCRRCGCKHRIFKATWDYGKDEPDAAI